MLSTGKGKTKSIKQNKNQKATLYLNTYFIFLTALPLFEIFGFWNMSVVYLSDLHQNAQTSCLLPFRTVPDKGAQ